MDEDVCEECGKVGKIYICFACAYRGIISGDMCKPCVRDHKRKEHEE